MCGGGFLAPDSVLTRLLFFFFKHPIQNVLLIEKNVSARMIIAGKSPVCKPFVIRNLNLQKRIRFVLSTLL